jgi:5-oxopent-3-ene-1,2,5-tricarboxylate decarboxylase/2-hydroxyhepta-2,4-diene-1,7-dioate isomerase
MPALPFAPWRLSGTVVNALLNHQGDWAALASAAEAPPYKGRAKAPVLEVKPRNTLVGHGSRIEIPAGVDALAIGATLAIVIGRVACRVTPAGALAHVAGYTLAAVLRVPHESHYRPALRQRARDGFCPLGPGFVPAAVLPAPDAATITLAIDGQVVQRAGTGARVRGVAALIADVSAFMTFSPGDVLLLGEAPPAPLARAGQSIAITLPEVGTLEFTLVPEAAA